MFKDMRLGTKLMLCFLVMGVLPFAVVGIISLTKASNSLSQQAFNQLESVREIKKAQIERYFAERKGDMGVLIDVVDTLQEEAFNKLVAIQEVKRANLVDYVESMKVSLRVLKDDPYTRDALIDFDRAYDKAGGKVGTKSWNRMAETYGPRFKDIVANNGWYDLFLISRDGEVVYSDARESDLGMNIPKSSLNQSSLGEAYAKAAKSGSDVVFADFKPYSPSNGEPAAFMMAQMQGSSGEKIGYVAFQVPVEKVNEIMLRRDGMGRTGESYLVGPDHLMRSDSYLDSQGHSVQASFKNNTTVDTVAVKEALAGNDGEQVITDYTGNPVLSAWNAVELGSGVRWGMMSEIDVAEAFSPQDENGVDFYKKYIEKYGYYDLFLINPDGYVFYTVTQEADYQSNMVNGRFANSGLGKLTRDVIQSRSFKMADFSPYEPSNGEPAAFAAQPVIHNGDVVMVVALQLPLEGINAIMAERSGMGDTGETYLVGSDSLMRSDSYLDQVNHTVKASFANPAKGKVDTVASREALSGVSSTEIIQDYNGQSVLSAFAPVDLKDFKWALIAEIDEAEAFAAIAVIKFMLMVVAAITIGAIVLIAIVLTRSITGPVGRTVEMVKGLEAGNLDARLNMDRKDEIGQMATALDGFADNMRDEVLAAFDALAQGNFTFKAEGVIREPLALANNSLSR
ncbi:MAG: cache and HAMP domain-containing protein, partial [Desulfuromonadales bacterium]|nr:cache and HAMP domain-containing protein [Desulfuromonadales bacterium]